MVAEHTTVLKHEVVAALAPRVSGVYVDATFGAGGHTLALLEAMPSATVVAIDRDRSALTRSTDALSRFGDRVRLIHGCFGDLAILLAREGFSAVDGILADLGVSSTQLGDPGRGLSFRAEGPLDMRMDCSSGATAHELLGQLSRDALADLLYRYGEERRSRRVARCIKLALEDGKLRTTLDLRRAVVRAVGPARVGGVDPATRTFQALRIAVNEELSELSRLLEAAPTVLRCGAVLAVVSFHSLEDRLVKQAFQDRAMWDPLFRKPVCASLAELRANPRARSAKLRAARHVGVPVPSDPSTRPEVLS